MLLYFCTFTYCWCVLHEHLVRRTGTLCAGNRGIWCILQEHVCEEREHLADSVKRCED